MTGAPSARICSRRTTVAARVVGDAHEERALQAARVGADGERGDGLVVALAADGQRRAPAPRASTSGTRRAGVVGHDEDLRAARALGELAGQLERVGQVGGGGRLPRSTRSPALMRPRSVASLATTRAVSPAAMTLTRPSDGTCAICSSADALGGGRAGPGRRPSADMRRRGVDDQHQVAREAGGVLAERPRDEEREERSRGSSWSSSSSERRSRCHGAFASTSRTSCCHRNVLLTVLLGPAQAQHVERDDDRHRDQPDQRERRQESHR